MSIRKHGNSPNWWIDIRTPSGKRIRQSTGTSDKKQAQEYHDRVKAELWREEKFGEVEHTFDEAAIRFLEESAGQSNYAAKVRHVIHWKTLFSGMPLRSLTTERIAEGLPTHRTYEHRPTKALSGATRNRYTATIMRILNLAEAWGWITKAPKPPKFKEAKVRIKFITQAQARQLLSAIPDSSWMKNVCAFALATGMRSNEILSLEWTKIDLVSKQAVVSADLAKSGRARVVPLNDEAIKIIHNQIGQHQRLVFTRGTDLQVKQIDARVLRRACKAVGIDDFRFHDFRHTWASWHAQAGTPLMVLKELGGWESIDMVQRYAHLAPSHLAHHANAVMFWSQDEISGQKKTSNH